MSKIILKQLEDKDTGRIVEIDKIVRNDEDLELDGKLTVNGDLEVKGNTTTVETKEMVVEDKKITLNKGGTDADGSGIEIEENGSIVASLEYNKTTGRFKDGTDDLARKGEVDNKADKVSGATEGNFAGLDSNGNLVDSGKKADDFADATHTHNWTDVNKTGSKLFDIEDVPPYTGNAGKVLAVNETEDGLEWVEGGNGGGNIPSNPYAIYRLNGDLKDSSGNGRDLTLYTGSPTYKTEGSTTYIDTRNNKIATRMDSGTLLNQWTFYVKVRDVGTAYRQAIFAGQANENLAISIHKNNNKYVLDGYKAGSGLQYTYASDVSVDGNWHKIAVSYNYGTIKIYMDGQFKVSKSGNLNFNCNTFFSDIYNTINEAANGEFDEIIVYNRVLTDDEAKSLTS